MRFFLCPFVVVPFDYIWLSIHMTCNYRRSLINQSLAWARYLLQFFLVLSRSQYFLSRKWQNNTIIPSVAYLQIFLTTFHNAETYQRGVFSINNLFFYVYNFKSKHTLIWRQIKWTKPLQTIIGDTNFFIYIALYVFFLFPGKCISVYSKFYHLFLDFFFGKRFRRP